MLEIPGMFLIVPPHRALSKIKDTVQVWASRKNMREQAPLVLCEYASRLYNTHL
jgi:hypothetical protein